jgi:2-oxoglutarate dehydrogenase E2 component (dihydrolipoamide succinyltransferase)
MAIRLIAPSMGEGVEELTVMGWLKKEGDPVKEFEVVVEVETDKVTTEIPSPVEGTVLKIVAQENSVVKVGSTLAWIGKPGEAIEKSVSPNNESQPVPLAEPVKTATTRVEPEQGVYTGRISPLVRNIATLNQVNLNLVQGTGMDGRITKDDIMAYLESKKAPTPEVTPVPQPQPVEAKQAVVELRKGNLIAHTSLRKQIAERMVNSKHTSPHVLTVMEADLSKVVAHRAANKEAFANQGVNLTLTAYFCAAIVSALKSNPEVNSSWTDEGIQLYNVINLGMATSLGKDGLIVPVIKDAGSLSLLGLAQKINDLSNRARAKKLLPDEVKGGTFTLTNHGSSGSLFASPIIFQPQAAILGTGMMQKRVVVVTDAAGNDSIAIRPMVYLSFVFDHRILDGEGADRFLKAVKDVLENWKE